MKTKSAVRLLCKSCRFVRRRGRVFVVCTASAKVRHSSTMISQRSYTQMCSLSPHDTVTFVFVCSINSGGHLTLQLWNQRHQHTIDVQNATAPMLFPVWSGQAASLLVSHIGTLTSACCLQPYGAASDGSLCTRAVPTCGSRLCSGS